MTVGPHSCSHHNNLLDFVVEKTSKLGATQMSLTSMKDGLRTGIDGLDYEHRKLVEEMEAICERFDHAVIEQEVSDLFGTIYATASAHFALEECLMREKKYALYEAHKADHERLLDRIRLMMESYEDGLCKSCGVSISACLETWLADHVKDADTALRTLAN